jgi:hypothetical protein
MTCAASLGVSHCKLRDEFAYLARKCHRQVLRGVELVPVACGYELPQLHRQVVQCHAGNRTALVSECFVIGRGGGVCLGEAQGHEGDHGLQDHGFVAGGQTFVVSDSAVVFADPGEGGLDDPAARQDNAGIFATSALGVIV